MTIPGIVTRRAFLGSTAAGVLAASRMLKAEDAKPALISITLDLEMSRNFPQWETTHWDYEKGNLDAATKDYTVEACRRVKEKGGVIHCFSVARVLEQEDVAWLKAIIADGHPVGNHTYDHVYVLATKPEEVQFRFKRAPWLMRGRPPQEVIADNIAMASEAIKTRLGVDPAGFRTPGGFAEGLKGREDVQKMILNAGFKWASCRYPSHPMSKPGERATPEIYKGIVAAQAAAQPFVYPTGLVEIPMSPVSDINAFRSGRWPLEDFLEAIRQAVTWCIDNGATFDFLAHPSCLGVADPQFKAVELICDLVAKAGNRAKLVPLDALAARAM